MATTWGQSSGGSTTWGISAGDASTFTAALNPSGAAVTDYFVQDNQKITFGNDNDFKLYYDSTDDRLEFEHITGGTVFSLSSTVFALDSLNVDFIKLNELSSLPTPEAGKMVFHNDEYYVGFSS
jgi:hypothetical protein